MLADSLPPTEIQAATGGPTAGLRKLRRVQMISTAGAVVVWILVNVFLVDHLLGLSAVQSIALIVGIGALLVIFGVFTWRRLSGVAAPNFTKLTVSDRTLTAVRADGMVVESGWADPTLRLRLTNNRPNDPHALRWLEFEGGGRRSWGSVTREGATLLEGQAARHGLNVTTGSNRQRSQELNWVEIRPKG